MNVILQDHAILASCTVAEESLVRRDTRAWAALVVAALDWAAVIVAVFAFLAAGLVVWLG